MGVLGLTSVLAKECPQVLKELPTRFKALAGKTVVIDATLFTIRFHLTRNPLPSRHIYAWYRLVSKLRADNVKVICVFDGKERHEAKKPELQRRKQTRDLTTARKELEYQRSQRLDVLLPTLHEIRGLPETDQPVIQRRLSEFMIRYHPKEKGRASPTSGQVNNGEGVSEKFDMKPMLDELEQISPPTKVVGKDKIEYLTVALTSAYRSFQESAEHAAAPSPETDADPSPGRSASKNQHQLSAEESVQWQKLLMNVDEACLGFQQLLVRSEELYESYQRRTDLPTDQTFAESRELLVAMGIPCVQSEAPYEGEGLASAIALAGHADYVASEDTDVIVYGAPLLRGLTNQAKPLVLIDSQDIITALTMTREEFIDFALLIGTDFTQRLHKVGPVAALKHTRKYGSIPRILENEKKIQLSNDPVIYLEQVEVARQIFTSLPPVPSPDELVQREGDEERVSAIIHNAGLSRSILDLSEDEIIPAFSEEAPFGEDVFGDKPQA